MKSTRFFNCKNGKRCTAFKKCSSPANFQIWTAPTLVQLYHVNSSAVYVDTMELFASLLERRPSVSSHMRNRSSSSRVVATWSRVQVVGTSAIFQRWEMKTTRLAQMSKRFLNAGVVPFYRSGMLPCRKYARYLGAERQRDSSRRFPTT